jgi:hypothetical protein
VLTVGIEQLVSSKQVGLIVNNNTQHYSWFPVYSCRLLLGALIVLFLDHLIAFPGSTSATVHVDGAAPPAAENVGLPVIDLCNLVTADLVASRGRVERMLISVFGDGEVNFHVCD